MDNYEALNRAHNIEALEEEVAQLRIMLCMSYSNQPYTDDSKLQDNEVEPCIDFKNDHVVTIKKKMQERLLIAINNT